MSELHKHDAGTHIVVTVSENSVPVDLSGFPIKKLLFRRKDKTTFERTADFLTDGTDGKLEYWVQDGEIDMIGKWAIEAYVETSGSYHWFSSVAYIEVKANIDIV